MTRISGANLKERNVKAISSLPLKSKRPRAYAAGTPTNSERTTARQLTTRLFHKVPRKSDSLKTALKFSSVGVKKNVVVNISLSGLKKRISIQTSANNAKSA